MSNNFSTIEEAVQAALDKQTLQCMCGRDYIDVQCTTLAGVLDLMHEMHWSNFRIKTKKKTVTYQTRLFYTIGNEVMPFNSLTHTQAEVENFSWFKRWLEPTQEHSFTYEEK